LGESLIVKLNVTDVEKSPDSNCFTITETNDTSAFRKAFSTLSPYKDGYQLTITTKSVVTEPIIGLRVSYHCEPQLDRDYVLLLDPAPYDSELPNNIASINQAAAIASPSTNITSKPKTKAPTNNAEATDANNTASDKAPAKVKRQSKKPRVNTSPSTDEKIMEAYTGKQHSPANQTPPAVDNSDLVAPIQPSATSKPYLSISGGNPALDGQKNLSLKFETQIDLNRVPPIAPIDSTEMMDEVTVITNRLTHLEKQILSLQTQNAKLKNEAELAKKELDNQKYSWLDYFLIAIGGALLLAGLEWLRRTLVDRRATKQALNWLNTDDTVPIDDEPTNSTSITPATMDSKQTKINDFSAPFLDEQNNDGKIEPTKTSTPSFTEPANDEHDSIIENADVFIEHDRPLLAIQLLQNHLNDFPTESPRIWIKLLSLIATEGSETEYEATAMEARKYFNIKVPNYAEATNEDTSSIEAYSNIVARLEGVWGSPFAVKFLNDLIYDQHAQPAEGFTPNNFEELFFLKTIAELLSTGVSTNQHPLYRNTTKELEKTVDTWPANTNLDNLAFNEAIFGNNMLFESALSTDSTKKSEQQSSHTAIDDEDFSIASFPDTSEPSHLNKPTKEETYSHFENSPFQKVPSYDVDMLVDFDDHIETAEAIADVSNRNDVADSTHMTQDITQSVLEKDDHNQVMAEELYFPLDLHPEETTPELITPLETNDKPTTQKDRDKDSNIIEWDLPKPDA
jgi:hypothetical protein